MRFKLLQRFSKDKYNPKILQEKLFKKNIEQREAFLSKLSRAENGHEIIHNLRESLIASKKQTEQTLYNIKSQFIVPTLTQIYGFDAANAITWPEVTPGEKLTSKLPQLPEIEFEDGTNPIQVEQLKSTFKAQVQQIDSLTLQIRHIAHSLNLIDNMHTANTEKKESGSTVSLH